MSQKAFNVYLPKNLNLVNDNNMTGYNVVKLNEDQQDFIHIDTVYFNEGTTELEVKSSLIDHDSYDPNIIVRLR